MAHVYKKKSDSICDAGSQIVYRFNIVMSKCVTFEAYLNIFKPGTGKEPEPFKY